MALERKKILMIAATPFFSDRGCHIRIYSEIKYLQKLGHRVTLVTYHIGDDVEGVDTKRTKNVPWYKKYTPGAAWGKVYLDLLLLRSSIREHKKMQPNMIHAHLYEGLLVAYLVKVVTRSSAPIIFDCQGSLTSEMYRYNFEGYRSFAKIFYPFFWGIEKFLLALPDSIICSSERGLRILKERFGIKEDRMRVVDDGFDEDLFSMAQKGHAIELKNALNIPAHHRVVMYTGLLDEAKGIKEYAKALPRLLERNKDLTFLFVGYGDREGELRDAGGIVTGRASYFKLPIYLALADLAIDPKRGGSESSGKLMNYLAARIPVACFTTPNHEMRQYVHLIDSFDEIVPLARSVLAPIPFDLNESGYSWRFLVQKIVAVYDSV